MSLLLDSIIASKYQSLTNASGQELSDLIKDVITHAISRIQQATEFPPVKEELELVKSIFQPKEGDSLINKYTTADLYRLSEAFIAAHELYAEWLKFIIEFVTIEWSYCFSEEDKHELLDLFFARGSPSISFMTLCQSIGAELKVNQTKRDTAEQVVLNEVSRWLVPFTENKFVQLLLEVNTDPRCMRHWPLLLVLITSLGDRLVNRLARKTDPRFLTPQYFVRLCEQVIEALKLGKYHHPGSENEVQVDWDQQSVINTWSQLCGKLSTLGHADTLVSRLVAWLMSAECQSVTWKSRLARIIEHVSDSQTENFIAALLAQLSLHDYHAARDTLKDLLALSCHKATVRYQLTNKLLIQRALDPLAHLLLVDYLYDTLPREIFVQTLLEIATIWSRQHVTEAQLIILTRALGRGLARLGSESQHEMRLLTTIFEGVSTHLATPPSVTRQSAESIAALTAHLTAPDITPPFENKPPLALGIGDDWLTVTVPSVIKLENKISENVPNNTGLPVRQPNQPKQTKKSHVQRDTDPDQLYLNDGEDSDDSLPEFTDTEDISDLSDVKVPVYLRDCLNNLMSDEPDLLEVTLHNLAALIRRAPDDLDELSVPIASALLHLNNEYQLRDFDRCLTDSLTALIAGSTVKVVTFITAQFYAANYSLQQRMLMLDVLARGARELSALPKPSSTSLNEPRNTQLTLASHAISVTRVNTRPTPPKTAVNKFAPHAGLFIYPLLQHYDRKSALLDLYNQDGIVLGQLLYSLGVFVECLNGNAAAPVLLQISHALLEVVWALRHHPALTVRRALLYLCVTMSSALPLAVLSADELRGEWSELLAWGVSVVKDDADEDCRVLATALVTKLVQLIDQNALQLDA